MQNRETSEKVVFSVDISPEMWYNIITVKDRGKTPGRNEEK